jgi:hypothetical protein
MKKARKFKPFSFMKVHIEPCWVHVPPLGHPSCLVKVSKWTKNIGITDFLLTNASTFAAKAATLIRSKLSHANLNLHDIFIYQGLQ